MPYATRPALPHVPHPSLFQRIACPGIPVFLVRGSLVSGGRFLRGYRPAPRPSRPARFLRGLAALAVAGSVALGLAAPAAAQVRIETQPPRTADQGPSRIPSHCIALARAPGIEYIRPASFGAPLAEDALRLSYVYHATFVLETAGVTVATDYTGFLGGTDVVPTAVTMNNAHSTHWTANPDPRIEHVLRGWDAGDGPADHHLDLGEMLIRNVPTDVRSGYGGVRENGNSIFVFEAAGLCVGHLGHLHHEPTEPQYAALGRLDVLMVPVDGGLTLDLPTMMKVVERLRSSMVIPMHWFGEGSLERFISGMAEQFAIDRKSGNFVELSLGTLPSRPTVVVLRPGPLD